MVLNPPSSQAVLVLARLWWGASSCGAKSSIIPSSVSPCLPLVGGFKLWCLNPPSSQAVLVLACLWWGASSCGAKSSTIPNSVSPCLPLVGSFKLWCLNPPSSQAVLLWWGVLNPQAVLVLAYSGWGGFKLWY